MGTFTATAYCPCEHCCGKWAQPGAAVPQRTAAGTKPRPGIAAADWTILPKFSVIRLSTQPDAPLIIEDTGSAIRGRALDLYFSTHEDALKWGRKTVRVQLWMP